MEKNYPEKNFEKGIVFKESAIENFIKLLEETEKRMASFLKAISVGKKPLPEEIESLGRDIKILMEMKTGLDERVNQLKENYKKIGGKIETEIEIEPKVKAETKRAAGSETKKAAEAETKIVAGEKTEKTAGAEKKTETKKEKPQELPPFEEIERRLEFSKREYLERFKEVEELRQQMKKAHGDELLKKQQEFQKAQAFLLNAEESFRSNEDLYKVAKRKNLWEEKRGYVAKQIFLQKGGNEIEWGKNKEKFLKKNQDEIEKTLVKEKEKIEPLLLGSLAYEMLLKEEELEKQKRQIIESSRRERMGWLIKLWDRYQALPYSRKVLVGAMLAGAGAGGAAVAVGAGFAALGIGALAAGRRFATGFVVGGPIKGLSEIIIGKKERKKLEELTEKRVAEIAKAISSEINQPEKIALTEEKVFKAMRHLDERISDLVGEREKIRSQSDKKRKNWTAIAILAGGLAANYDNIIALVKGAKNAVISETAINSHLNPSETMPPTGATAPKVVGTAPIETLKTVKGSVGMVPVEKYGFWGAAQKLSENLGLSKEQFVSAWSHSFVSDPQTGNIFPIADAHFVTKGAQLAYNPSKNIFEAVAGPEVKIGGLDKLIEAYHKLGKPLPFWIMKWLKG